MKPALPPCCPRPVHGGGGEGGGKIRETKISQVPDAKAEAGRGGRRAARRNLAAILALSTGLLLPAAGAQAPVVLVTTDCQDYFVVDLGAKRYALLEWFGGYRPEKGDMLVGGFSHFGARDMTVNGQRLRVYVEDYDLDQDAINDKLTDKCR